jgi:hypothetical protein
MEEYIMGKKLVPYGFWGPHHRLLGLTEKDFPSFNVKYLNSNIEISDSPDETPLNLMLMKWEKKTVTVEISTKGRYDSTLPLVLLAVSQQTVSPDEILIFDDNDNPMDLRNNPMYKYIFGALDIKGISWKVIYGQRKGQVLNHQKAMEISNSDYIWRLDDDNFPEPNVLENLLMTIKDDKVGAVGALVWHTDNPVLECPSFVKGSITLDLEFTPVEWFKHNTKSPISVQHLYSTFLFKREIGLKVGYPMDLSVVGHHEETTFSHGIYREGYKLLVNPNVVVYHFRYAGGIRSFNNHKLWEDDDKIFQKRLKDWGVDTTQEKLIVLDCGLGDHYAFKIILPEIKEKYKDYKLAISCCYPEVFEGENVRIIGIYETKIMYGNLDKYNVYRYCIDRNWNKSLVDAFREMYVDGKVWE